MAATQRVRHTRDSRGKQGCVGSALLEDHLHPADVITVLNTVTITLVIRSLHLCKAYEFSGRSQK